MDLDEVERTVQRAIRARSFDGLSMLGHGEISMVFGWPGDAPAVALKRLPPFAARPLADHYVDQCRRWIDLMAERGVDVLPTEQLVHERDDGKVVVYHRQPLVDPARIGHRVLRDATPASRHELLDAIVDAVGRGTSERVGVDAQAANWFWHDGVATMLDVTSPFLLTADGTDLEYDTGMFVQEYPAALRGYLRKEILGLLPRYTTPAGVLSDMVANLFKEGLEQWAQPTVDTARERLGVEVDLGVCREMFHTDRKLFPLALRLKRVQRRWMRLTGRRYESLIPERTTYETAR